MKDRELLYPDNERGPSVSAGGFPEERIFATQGDYGMFQCAKACHKKLYENEKEVRAMVAQQKI